MEIWQLRTFCEIAETLNFTKASEKLHLTQSAVSHQIKALEEELGVPLFIRAKRGVLLTDAGKVALEHAKRILAEANEMLEQVADREKAIAGRVRVAAATQALVYLFAPLFEEFMDQQELVELVFRTTATTEQTVDDILSGVADVQGGAAGQERLGEGRPAVVLRRRDERMWLLPEPASGDQFPETIVDEHVEVWGVVVGLARRYR